MKMRAEMRRSQHTEEAYRKNAPQGLPRVRPRALSYPLPLNQWQSALFSRLSSEIRQLIWTEVLGGYLLHIVRAPKRLLAIKCVESFGPELHTGEHNCWGWTDWRRHLGTTPGFYLHPRGPKSAEALNLLPLLQVCRIIYTEAISILYAKNIFDINHPDTFVYLQQTVLSERLDRIRILNFTWEFHTFITMTLADPYGIATWSDVCNMLSGLTDLRELTMHLDGDNFQFLDRTEFLIETWRAVLDMLARITTVEKFKVFIPWSEDERVEVVKGCGYPFELAPEVEVPMSSDPRGREVAYF